MTRVLSTRVLITRPEPGASRTLKALHSCGLEVVSIALTEISKLAFAPPNSDFEALIITSQNAILHGAAVLAQHKSKPIFVVGRRTEQSLSVSGFEAIEWAETAMDLLPKILAHAPKHLLYICGQTRRPELESALIAAGIHVEALEVYAATQTQNAAKKLAMFFAASQNAIVLFHAPSAAAAFCDAVKGLVIPDSTHFLCLSSAIAKELPETLRQKCQVAKRPDEDAMLEHLDKMLASDHLRRA